MKKSTVSLLLMSDSIGPNQLSSGLKAPIDASWRKGDRRGNTSLFHAENGVEIGVPVDGLEDVEEQLLLLMERLRPDAECIRLLGCDSVQLTIVVYDSTPPGFHFEPELIEFLGSLKASTNIDQYLIDEDDK